MKTFKQFLAENIYPGGYYDMHGNLQVHFDNAEEKKKFDDDPRNDTRSDDWHYENDKSHENNVKTFKKLHSIAGKVDKDSARPKEVVDEVIEMKKELINLRR